MALLHFVTRVPGRQVKVLHVNHGTKNADSYMDFVRSYCEMHGLVYEIYYMPTHQDRTISLEHWWSRLRREWFATQQDPVYLAHHLDDQVETWLMSCLQGQPMTMPWVNAHNCYRPFVLTPKSNLYEYAKYHGLEWVEDPTNKDPTSGYRNRVRNTLLPAALETHKGLYTVIRGKILADWDRSRKDVQT